MSAPLEEALAIQALEALKQHNGHIGRAAASLGLRRTTYQSRLDIARHMMREKAPSAELADANRIYELEAQLRTIRASTLTDEYVKRKIIGIKESLERSEEPSWLITKTKGGGLSPGVPMSIWSDWHWGEVVSGEQIGGVNQYDMGIAHDRARRLVEKTVYLLRQHIVHPEYPGIVIALGGDMMSGDIHDELTTTNELPMMPCLLDLHGVMRWAIKTIADEFGHVFLPCVTGNHGRNTRKPRAKDRAFTNFDWLLYSFLAQSFEGDKRIQFLIPDGPDALFRVYGHRFLLTHGDQFRGGDGMIGHFGPVMRGHKKKLSRNADVGQEFDTMLHGHFHTFFPTQKIIGNGSLKGYEEYANSENFAYEPPIQALWICHYEHGITQHLPVYLEPHAGREQTREWISWS